MESISVVKEPAWNHSGGRSRTLINWSRASRLTVRRLPSVVSSDKLWTSPRWLLYMEGSGNLFGTNRSYHVLGAWRHGPLRVAYELHMSLSKRFVFLPLQGVSAVSCEQSGDCMTGSGVQPKPHPARGVGHDPTASSVVGSQTGCQSDPRSCDVLPRLSLGESPCSPTTPGRAHESHRSGTPSPGTQEVL